jgi:transcriptional regulator with XRE-family HTH domain
MQTARMELKLSQKEVAQKINEKPSVLQDYESGKAIPNAQILAKLERTLGVKLRGKSPWFQQLLFWLTVFISEPSGSDIGKKLEGLKKS